MFVLAALAALTVSGPGPEEPTGDLRDALAGRFALPDPTRPLPLRIVPLARFETVGSPEYPSQRSREALAVARWHDSALARLEARGGYAALAPAQAVEVRLRLEVVESWFWRDASGELHANPKPFAEVSSEELRRWTAPVDSVLGP